jgi:hypothetical protein
MTVRGAGKPDRAVPQGLGPRALLPLYEVVLPSAKCCLNGLQL